ncbi:MAG: cytochrome c oxidase assembly protein [Novosphingobium sp.]
MLAFALAMLGVGYAAVPLYRIFCQVTGFGGTTQRVGEAQAATVKVAAQTISVRFDGNVEHGMPWRFAPEQVTQTVRIGQRTMAYYKARNDAAAPVTGIASFNVSPERAGKYFTKVHCFCFDRQTLAAGQEVDMPVQYYVDPAILSDPEARDIEQITLSYTFHVATDQAAANPLDRGGPAG